MTNSPFDDERYGEAMSTTPPDRIVLVTGASSGIGEATVRALRAKGFEVHAAARRLDRLEVLANETGCVPVRLDVRDREAVSEVAATLDIDILVNNAGLGRAMGDLANATIDDIERTIDTNVTGAIHMVAALIPGMIDRRRGHIVNMSSVAALGAVPAALYGASKAALHMFSRNLRLELQGTGVRVTEICPGRVATEFYDVAIDDPDARRQVVETDGEVLRPSDVADAVLYAVTAPWRVNISLLEIFPTEQAYGGANFVPVESRGDRQR